MLNFPLKVFFYDSGGYWIESKMFVVNGHFSLLNYNAFHHGYFFPLLLQVPLQFSTLTGLSEVLGFRIISAIAAAFCLTVIYPKFFEELFGFHAKPIETLVFALLVTFFWYGFFAYPLSDFPALTFFLIGMILCLKVFKSTKALWFKGILTFLAGICLAASTSIRPVYLIPLLLLMLFILMRLALSKFTVGGKALLVSSIIVGSIIIFIPQAMINRIHYQVNSPFPQMQNVFIGDLYTGLQQQRALSLGAPELLLYMPDNQGIEIFKKNIQGLGENRSLVEYFGLVCRQPFDMAALYVRHLFNGLDILSPTLYFQDLNANQIVYRFVNYTLWFLVIMLIWKRGISIKHDNEKMFFCFILILPALLAIPGHIEIRYFLPIYILMYGAIGFWFFSKRDIWKQSFTLRSMILYICFVLACFTFSSFEFSTVGILLQN